ncbi:hypothetical protein RS030_1100 [Cryptosporidium xiaoi]|uniref:Uncharacterized protein n=1 Tax=Cryptosporidium xiaoi TaxID=659607 RepID=A0AAV9Y3J3_9CRYT
MFLVTILFIKKIKSIKHVENTAIDVNVETRSEDSIANTEEEAEVNNDGDSLDFKLREIGEYSYFLTAIELQKKIIKCSKLIERNKSRIIEIRVNSKKKGTTQEIKVLNYEKAMCIDNNKRANMYCNMFINLLLYKRIKNFYNEEIDSIPKNEDNIGSEMEKIARDLVINEENAAFIRSLVQKTKCESFQENVPCKLLTNKLMNYMAMTPSEIVQEFENVVIEDSNE